MYFNDEVKISLFPLVELTFEKKKKKKVINYVGYIRNIRYNIAQSYSTFNSCWKEQ